MIEETKPTLLIDEADTFLQGNDELRGILNSGYARQTAFVVRVANELAAPRNKRTGNGVFEPMKLERSGNGTRLARFSCWCPKAVAAIGRLPDTLADRCIVIRMHRKKAGERCDRLKTFDGEVLRRKCARFVADHAEAIRLARPQIPDGLNDRAADIWEPLLVLAELEVRGSRGSESESGSESGRRNWVTVAREAAVGLTAAAQQSHPIASLLMDISVVFLLQQKDKLFSRDLVKGLNHRGLRPWTGMVGGRELTEINLARVLRAYGLRPRTVWIEGACAKGYMRADFTEVFQRYVPRSEVEALQDEVVPASEQAAFERRKKEAEDLQREMGALEADASELKGQVREQLRERVERLRELQKRVAAWEATE